MTKVWLLYKNMVGAAMIGFGIVLLNVLNLSDSVLQIKYIMRIFANIFSVYDNRYCYHIVCGFLLDFNRKTYKYK